MTKDSKYFDVQTFLVDSAATASAKESELDNPSFLYFKSHDFTHCVSDHLNILVLHPDHSQALKRP